MTKEIKEKYYDVAVSDFDGTLARSDKTVSETTLQQIKNFQSHGGIFAVCTGRMTSAILPFVKENALGDYVISFDGGAITEVKSGKTVYSSPLDYKAVIKLLKYAEEKGRYLQTYPEDYLLVKKATDYTAFYTSVTKARCVEDDDIIGFYERTKASSGKALFYIGDADPNEMIEEIRDVLGEGYNVFRSNSGQIDVCVAGVNKASGIRVLCDIVGKSPEKLICFGDETNDEAMLDAAALSVVTENGNPKLKEKADVVCLSCDEGGVGYALEKYGV